jgi:hypothetical protein
MKKVKIFYDELTHHLEKTNAYELTAVYNNTVKELESIIKKPIEDYKAFRNDAYNYSLDAIKKEFPKPFDLDLGLETTLKMIGIDLAIIKRNSEILRTSPYKIVINANGTASPGEDKEPYTYYAETPEQFERLEYCNSIIAVAEKALVYNKYLHKGNIILGFLHFCYNDPQHGYQPNWQFVLNGIKL